MKLEDALTKLTELREQVVDKGLWGNPVALSELAVKISTYNSYVAENIADAKWAQLAKEHESFRAHKKDGASDTGAGGQARLEARDERREHDQLDNIYKSNNSLLKTVDSRIYVLTEQMRREQ